jgi:hypothetical protein
LRVDGRDYRIDMRQHSKKLALADDRTVTASIGLDWTRIFPLMA